MPITEETYALFATDFGHRVQCQRRDCGITQADLAKKIGVSKTTIQNYEAGNIPKGMYLFKLSRELKCSIDYLIIGEESPYIQEDWIPEIPSGMTKEELNEYNKEKKSWLNDKCHKGKISDEDPKAVADGNGTQGGSGAIPRNDFHLGMGDSMELLVNIHKSGNKVLIQAINANLMAFNEAIENRERADITINAVREMKERMVTLEGEMAELRKENLLLQQKLLSRDEESEAAAG